MRSSARSTRTTAAILADRLADRLIDGDGGTPVHLLEEPLMNRAAASFP